MTIPGSLSILQPHQHLPQLQLPLALLLQRQPGSSRLWPPGTSPAAAKPKAGGAASPAAQLHSQRGSEPRDLSGRGIRAQHCGALGGDRLVTDAGGVSQQQDASSPLPEPSRQWVCVAQNISSCSRRRLSILSSLALVKVQQPPGPQASEADPLTFSTDISGTKM